MSKQSSVGGSSSRHCSYTPLQLLRKEERNKDNSQEKSKNRRKKETYKQGKRKRNEEDNKETRGRRKNN